MIERASKNGVELTFKEFYDIIALPFVEILANQRNGYYFLQNTENKNIFPK